MPETIERPSRRKLALKEEFAESSVSFKPLADQAPAIEECCLEENRPLSNMLRILVDEALIARGKLKPRQKRA